MEGGGGILFYFSIIRFLAVTLEILNLLQLYSFTLQIWKVCTHIHNKTRTVTYISYKLKRKG